MSTSRTTRMRKADLRAEREEAVRAEEQKSIARREAQAVAKEPTPDLDPAPRLQEDDLLALASMDPAELALLMDGAVGGVELSTGDKVTGVITRVNHQGVLVDIGHKAEAWIEREQLGDVKVGQSIEAFVVHMGESHVRLSTQLSGEAASAHLDDALASGIPVEGRVVGCNTGGLDVRIGDVRAFCPRSLISRGYIEEPAAFVGQTLQFKIIEMGDKVVLSRRALEEERAEAFAVDFWQRVAVGDELEGTVRNIQPFGAFVDVGGVDGLIPKSEMSWSSDAAVTDSVSLGQRVNVRVHAVDAQSKKLTLSLKNQEQAPWARTGSEFIEGGVYDGTVVRITTFGAFIRLGDGLDGLVHSSKMPGGVPDVGETIKVRVLSIDDERQRISLAPWIEGQATEPIESEQVSGVVADVMRNGVVVQLDDGRAGWLPASEVELPAGTVLAQRFRRGRKLSARVKSSQGNRITLTTRAETDDNQWRQHMKPKKSDSLGTFGDLFAGLKLK